MNTQHTPGPWSFLADENRPWIGTVYAAPDGGPICSLAAPVHIMEANARLIAAAPELLEALEAVQDYFDEYNTTEAVKALVASAIAKATAN